MKVHRSNQELQDTIEGYKMLIEEQKKEIIETLHKHSFFKQKKGCSFVDGARYEDEDGWFLIRTSNTEAKISVRVESITQDGFARLKMDCSTILQNYNIVLPKDI